MCKKVSSEKYIHIVYSIQISHPRNQKNNYYNIILWHETVIRLYDPCTMYVYSIYHII